MKEHIVCLKDEARQRLQELVRSGTRSVRVVRRASILLKSDEGFTDEEIAEHVDCSDRTVRSVRKRFCTEGLDRALYDAPRSGAPPTFTPRQQQRVVALACTDPPEGRTRWTLELLCERARFVRDLLRRYPKARRIHLVLDNLNTHNEKSLIETFDAKQAKQLRRRIEWHHTPKHASWLNMAEIEIAVMSKQCLGRRLATLQDVQRHTATWSRDRNRRKAMIHWTFNCNDARRVFPELYRKTLAG